MESVAYVGMDVDKKKIAMAVVAGYEAQPRVQRIVPNNLAALRKFFGELTEQYENVTACYEAGACGFELYRRVTDINVACAVVAPTSIPRKTNDRIKTDRRDAVKLAIEFRNGNLSPVYVPSRRGRGSPGLPALVRGCKDGSADGKTAAGTLSQPA
jgi:transposase